MTPKSNTMDPAAEMHVSPFEQITQLENEQEARVTRTLEEAEAEKRESEKMIAQSEKTQEAMMREEATKELKEYAQTEPAGILKRNEEETVQELSSLGQHAEKMLTKTAEKLIEPILDGSIFSTAA